MRKIPKKTFKFTEIIKNHIKDNIKSYILVSLIRGSKLFAWVCKQLKRKQEYK